MNHPIIIDNEVFESFEDVKERFAKLKAKCLAACATLKAIRILARGKGGCGKKSRQPADLHRRILTSAREFPQGETKTAILSAAKARMEKGGNGCEAFDDLVAEGKLIKVRVQKGNREMEGYKVAQ